jgi:nicotinamide-nucleotide adenylyltransferase
MIQQLATHIRQTSSEPIEVGLINEATFAGKSQAIHHAFSEMPEFKNTQIRLTFLIGTDTLARFFVERYYPPGKMDEILAKFFDEEGSGIVCARRGGDGESRRVEENILERKGVDKWVKSGQVSLWGSGAEDWVEMSSTGVPKAVTREDGEGLAKLVVPKIAQYIREQDLYRD